MERSSPGLLAHVPGFPPSVCPAKQGTAKTTEPGAEGPIPADCKDGRVKKQKRYRSGSLSTYSTRSGKGCKDGRDKSKSMSNYEMLRMIAKKDVIDRPFFY